MERETVELGANDRRPENASHEIVLTPHPATGRWEEQVKRSTLARDELLRSELGSNDGQMDDALRPDLVFVAAPPRAPRSTPDNPLRYVEVRAAESEELPLTQACQSSEGNQTTFDAEARKSLNFVPREKPCFPLLMSRRP
jgi:hypothetical protein